MKSHLLGFFISAAAFVVATIFLPGLNYGGSNEVLVRAAAVFALINTFFRPVISIILLPINFLALGLLGGLTGLIILWLVSVIVPGFSIGDSHFQGLALLGQSIPAYDLSAILTAVFGAVLIGFISTTLYWLVR